MRKSPTFILAALFLSAALSAAEEGRFFTYPTISGDRIAFTYESDLWTAPAKGGVATRLTTFPGTENFAKFSPDGQWLAFTRRLRRRPGRLPDAVRGRRARSA
ncbi:MAG: hypothetical protein MZW92_60525 [Comamonadaceae bacterium]|nr:hypothetical protein [Comamonadaceae bacterium]